MASLLQLACSSNFILGIILARHIRRRTFAYIAAQIYARKADVRARKIYDCSWQDENIKIQRIPRTLHWESRNNTPAFCKLGELRAKFEVYSFGSSWKKHDETDKKSPHIIEGPSCALYAAWKFHSSPSPQYSIAIKLRLLFAAFSDTLLYRWQRQDKNGKDNFGLLRLQFLTLERTKRNYP